MNEQHDDEKYPVVLISCGIMCILFLYLMIKFISFIFDQKEHHLFGQIKIPEREMTDLSEIRCLKD